MKKFVLILMLFANYITIKAQNEEKAIRETLQKYIDGSSYNNQALIESAFFEDADLFLSKKDQELWILTPKEYSNLFKDREQGKFNGRVGKILMIDYANNIACAKAEILIPKRDLRFIDIFLLKELEGEWKIISKAATQITQ